MHAPDQMINVLFMQNKFIESAIIIKHARFLFFLIHKF